MIRYTKHPLGDGSAIYDCYCGTAKVGQIAQEVDGFYYFWPFSKEGMWAAWILHDIARKLDALNEAWNQRLNDELEKLPTAQEACQEFTPETKPKSHT